jgi:hypothetical protein
MELEPSKNLQKHLRNKFTETRIVVAIIFLLKGKISFHKCHTRLDIFKASTKERILGRDMKSLINVVMIFNTQVSSLI